jgi:hypothetical protein
MEKIHIINNISSDLPTKNAWISIIINLKHVSVVFEPENHEAFGHLLLLA